ncbi:hypothetical protein [Flavobacterium daejeonense]|uniref:hypothetical protein n=1 Tax=Flavobacterium daejeonense TaxID=350893 RepID=UPI00138E515D|nr:hypothetical protein [Flavobacterium daejeonense]
MKNLFLFFIVNIISVISISSAMGTKTLTGIIIAFFAWGYFLNRIIFVQKKSNTRKRFF